LLKALKKFRYWLYGVRFLVETDAKVLAAQLNRSATDLPGALVTQWMAWIRLFDFEVRHIPGSRNVVADALSRRPPTEDDIKEVEEEQPIEDWIDSQLQSLRLQSVRLSPVLVGGSGTDDEPATDAQELPRPQPSVLEDYIEPFKSEEYSEESCQIAEFLLSGMRKPSGVPSVGFKKWKNEALNYVVRGGHLFRRADKRNPIRRVLDTPELRQKVIKTMHHESGHQGKESTYRRVADRYFWRGMSADCFKFSRTCEVCQKRLADGQEEELHSTFVNSTWEKVGLDVVSMPEFDGFRYMVHARSDLSGWPEARAIRKNDSATVATFLWEEVICRHGVPSKLVVDGGPENKDLVATLAEKYGISRVVVSAYHPQANGMIERHHRSVVDALSKLTGGGAEKNWVRHLPAVLWAERTTVKQTTGMTPYEVEYAQRPVLPVELDVTTWSVMRWKEVRNTADLIAMRARALERRDEDLEEARLRLRRSREENKVRFDLEKNVRDVPLPVGMLVLLRNEQKRINMSRDMKLVFRWNGPYRVVGSVPEKGTYLLAELDGARLRGTFAGNRLKRFFVANREGASGEVENKDSDQVAAQSEESQDSEVEEGYNDVDRWKPTRQPNITVEIPRHHTEQHRRSRRLKTAGEAEEEELEP